MYSIPFLDLPPMDGADGTVRLPGSKSISNRVLLLAGLCSGTTVVHDLLESDDTRVMLAALRQLGCGLEHPDATSVRVTGLAGRLSVKSAALHLGNAGTAMRPLAAALAVMAATQGGSFELSGVARMHERPIGDLVDALRQLGCAIAYLGADGFPPLRVGGGDDGHGDRFRADVGDGMAGDSRSADGHPAGRGGPRRALLRLADPIRVRGDVSSQFLTALLLALPLASDAGHIRIEVVGELISRPYIEITLNLLLRFGIEVRREGWQAFTIPRGSAYRSPGEIHVEGDASSASYFIALGAIAAHDGRAVRIEGVGADSIQGDILFVDAARQMGAEVNAGPGWLQVRRGQWPLRAITLDCNAIPDAAMTLAVMAMYADGTTRLDNIASWRVKETDRIAAMAAELRKLGAGVLEGADFIEITPPAAWTPATIQTYDDHRMAMCLSLAAFGGLSSPSHAVPVRILDPRCVGKTFPDYFETLFLVSQAAPQTIPVITIDGPTASGKGTLASAVAHRLGYHTLDSGSLYRVTALAAIRRGVHGDDPVNLAALARSLPLRFSGERLCLEGVDITDELRLEAVGSMASRIAALPEVRQALNDLQLSFRRLPGLVADGRDMGTVIFPEARLKVFLTASAAMRAERRHKQLIQKGISTSIADLRADLEARDERDRNRAVAPLKPAGDAVLLDNSALSIDESVDRVLGWWQQRHGSM